MKKLYIVVDSDLSPGLQCAQACHALRAFIEKHPAIDKEWFEKANNLVVLSVPGELYLEHLIKLAMRWDVHWAIFLEPDLDEQMTAIALCGDRAHRIASALPLALRQPASISAMSGSITSQSAE